MYKCYPQTEFQKIQNIDEQIIEFKIPENPVFSISDLGDDEGQRINQFVATLTTLLSYHPKIAATPSHVSAMLSLLSDFCGHIPDPSHILQNILESDRAEWKPSLYCQLLSCCFDVFQIHPPAMQLIMGIGFILNYARRLKG